MVSIARLKPPDSRLERRIITAMIISSDYLRQVSEIYKPECLKTKFTKIIADWCIEYWHEFKTAPQRHIQDIFYAKTKINFPDDQIDAIKEFLTEISEEYETADKLNVKYLFTKTEFQFRLNKADNARIQLGNAIVANDPEQAEAIMKEYQRPISQQTIGIDILRDKDALITTFSQENNNEKIIKFPGALGQAIGYLEREQLVTFVGNTGVGKSWWLLQLAWWFSLAGFDVIYVSFEMSKSQIMKRTYQWLTGHPLRDSTVFIPKWDCLANQMNKCNRKERTSKIGILNSKQGFFEPKNYPKSYKPCISCKEHNKNKYDYEPTSFFIPTDKKAITLESGLKIRKVFQRTQKRAGIFDYIRWPSGQKSIDDLKLYLSNTEDYQDKIYDVIITDYASKMKPCRRYSNERFGIGEIFQDHKSLAQEKNCLVVTAHQGNTVRDDKDLKRGSWQEAIVGLNECDIAININQKQEEKKGRSEKEMGLYRLSLAKKRDDDFNINAQIYVLSCLQIGRPYIDSYIKR